MLRSINILLVKEHAVENMYAALSGTAQLLFAGQCLSISSLNMRY